MRISQTVSIVRWQRRDGRIGTRTFLYQARAENFAAWLRREGLEDVRLYVGRVPEWTDETEAVAA